MSLKFNRDQFLEWLLIALALFAAGLIILGMVDHVAKNIDNWAKAQTAEAQR